VKERIAKEAAAIGKIYDNELGSAALSEAALAVTNTTHSISSKDRQLAIMLLMDILIYGLFFSTFAIFLLYQQITQY
jgi:hypothetical protein